MTLGTLRILGSLLRGQRGDDHQARLEGFYGPQAEGYDRFREGLLHGRRELVERLPLPPQAHVIELGAGTGRNAEFLAPRLDGLRVLELVDLCRPLLAQAQARVERHGWQRVEVHHGDACAWTSAHGPADAVLFSYSLSMIPDWFAAIDHALELLKPGGHLGVVDFHRARRHPAPGRVRHGRLTRTLWPAWFGWDGVLLREDLLPYLEHRLETLHCHEGRGPVPLLPLARVPHLVFVGRKRA